MSPPTKTVANPPSKNKGTAKTNDTKKSGTIPSIVQPVLKPLQTDSSMPPPASQRTSINARPDKNLASPCYSPSINKDDDENEVHFN